MQGWREFVIRIFADTSIYFLAFRGVEDVAERARAVLLRRSGLLLISDHLKLEVLPKAIFHKNAFESRFYQSIFSRSLLISSSEALQAQAMKLACLYGLAAGDACLIAAACLGGADLFVTTEKVTKPMYSVRELEICHLMDMPKSP